MGPGLWNFGSIRMIWAGRFFASISSYVISRERSFFVISSERIESRNLINKKRGDSSTSLRNDSQAFRMAVRVHRGPFHTREPAEPTVRVHR